MSKARDSIYARVLLAALSLAPAALAQNAASSAVTEAAASSAQSTSSEARSTAAATTEAAASADTASQDFADSDVTTSQAPLVPHASPTSVTCSEHLPSGKERPLVAETFPERGLSGHAAPLVLKVTHGKGERVLDDSFDFQAGSEGASALRRAGFEFPTKGSPATPTVQRTEGASNATTTVTLQLIPLPGKSGQQSLTLPPLPIAIARPSGEIMTLCSASHDIVVEDPTANVPNATPKRHPGPERQRELWALLRNLVYGAVIGVVLAGLLALLFRWYKRRPKAVPPPPPPRPAWEIALEELHDIRHSDLIRQGRLTAHLERVNHTLRAYLGRTYNFDGLESTTEEVLRSLARSTLPQALYTRTEIMLRDSDLVKFAKIQPTEAQCHGALEDVEQLVKQTMHEERTSVSEGTSPSASAPVAGVIRPSEPDSLYTQAPSHGSLSDVESSASPTGNENTTGNKERQ